MTYDEILAEGQARLVVFDQQIASAVVRHDIPEANRLAVEREQYRVTLIQTLMATPEYQNAVHLFTTTPLIV